MNDQPTRSDYNHVKLLALLAILATQIPFAVRTFHRASKLGEHYSLSINQHLYEVKGNPIDGIKTNYVTVIAVTNGWVKLLYEDGMQLTLETDVVETCYKPVPAK